MRPLEAWAGVLESSRDYSCGCLAQAPNIWMRNRPTENRAPVRLRLLGLVCIKRSRVSTTNLESDKTFLFAYFQGMRMADVLKLTLFLKYRDCLTD